MKLAAFLSLIFITSVARASTVVIDDKRCVSADAKLVHKSITAYENYSSLPGASFKIKLKRIGTVTLLSMEKSQLKMKVSTESGTDANVWVVLRPMEVEDGAYYPKFLIHCTSTVDAADHFTHGCQLAKDKLHYGLDDFQSTLTAAQGSRECPAGQTYLDYRLVLVANEKHVEQIKAKAVEPYGVLGYIVALLFDEEAFFRDYYRNFYEGWVKSLTAATSKSSG
jgi:hypothetical protein